MFWPSLKQKPINDNKTEKQRDKLGSLGLEFIVGS